MRPKITCHMVTSLDGRLYPDRWAAEMLDLVETHYDATAASLGADGWIVGRKTMAAYMAQDGVPPQLGAPRPREPFAAERDGRDVAVAIDPGGRLRHESGEIDGDQAVSVLSEKIPDGYLARLKELGVSYVFAGPDGDELEPALDALGGPLGIGHLLLEGGGITNGAFLAADLIDEVSTLICPTIDGLAGIPSIYERAGPPGSRPVGDRQFRLLSCEPLEGGIVWLRHEVVRR